MPGDVVRGPFPEIEREPPVDDAPAPVVHEKPKFTRAYDMRSRHVQEFLPEESLCEKAVVGAILTDGGMRTYCNDLSGAEFGDRALGRVYDMLMSIDGPVDLPIAYDEAVRRNLSVATGTVGLGVYLASLMDLLPSYDSDGFSAHVRSVKRGAVARRAEAFRLQMAKDRASR